MPNQIKIRGGIVIVTDPIVYKPTITLWNRLEGRPRTEDFSRAIKAEVRDSLWMLSKQWQMGELMGDDAGSAIFAKTHIKTTALAKYQATMDGPVIPMEKDVPLEAKVEQQAIPFQQGQQKISLDLRLLMGRHWFKLLKKNGFDLRNKYMDEYGFDSIDPDLASDIQISAHQEVWQQFASIANRCIDGYRFYSDIKQAGALASDKVTPPAGREDELNNLGKRFIKWFEGLFYQPKNEENLSWKPQKLEYQFACSAPEGKQEKVFKADEYYHGHLDWYNLDIHNDREKLAEPGMTTPAFEDALTLSFLPSPITFPGMPHRRWWMFEDWRTDLGKINPDTTDINQLMLLDFGLNYANDWLMLPLTLPVGSVANVKGLMVTNVFGENIWVEPAKPDNVPEAKQWGMFHLNKRGNMNEPLDLSLLLLPTAQKVQEGKPIEEAYLLRDEVANIVWGVESLIPLATGKSKRGKEAGLELRAKYQQLLDKAQAGDPPIAQPLLQNEANIKYQLVNTVPEHWIPFIPVHKGHDNREIQLQRSAMPRVLERLEPETKPDKIEPRTSILREGLNKGKVYFIHEEEVPRAGIRIHRSFQRTRWYNGRVFTWLGFKKSVGRGEGHSGLAFDQIIPKEESD